MELDKVRTSQLGVKRLYYKRIASFGRPYDTKAEMETWLGAQPPGRLARCLQNLTILGQPKAYLY